MSESLSDAVREAAHGEAVIEIRFLPTGIKHEDAFSIFADGAVWLAGRLPSRDEIEEVLLGQHVDFYDETSTLETADEILALIWEHVTKEENDNT